ncbi:MAG: 4-demethylwyosine synthase TYW1, partial [Thermoplasmata archaeon]|nr:4-demethylwyosine synthase TYW1 [Thermoplasmata archaeon]
MNPRLREMLERQHYRVVGSHGGVKLCHWLKKKLTTGEACYKEKFYGIESHRCLQMTPAVDACTQSCLFCWRFQGFTRTSISDPDDPKALLDGSIEAQRKLISGFGGDPRVSREMYEEAKNPNQIAISLSGEPTLYERLGEFIEEAKRRNMTTFVVS